MTCQGPRPFAPTSRIKAVASANLVRQFRQPESADPQTFGGKENLRFRILAAECRLQTVHEGDVLGVVAEKPVFHQSHSSNIGHAAANIRVTVT